MERSGKGEGEGKGGNVSPACLQNIFLLELRVGGLPCLAFHLSLGVASQRAEERCVAGVHCRPAARHCWECGDKPGQDADRISSPSSDPVWSVSLVAAAEYQAWLVRTAFAQASRQPLGGARGARGSQSYTAASMV